MTEQQLRDLPTAAQYAQEMKRLRYRKDFAKMLRSTVSSLLVVAAIAVLISMLFLPVLRVTGTSMTPTLQENEFVICSEWSNFDCGDIIAFHFNNKILLKRVIGTAGDWIEITEDGTVYVNNTEIDEPYVSGKSIGECDLILPYQVPESRIFVMGDHRDVSIDSRSKSIGCVANEQIVGKVVFRIWPLDALGGVR